MEVSSTTKVQQKSITRVFAIALIAIGGIALAFALFFAKQLLPAKPMPAVSTQPVKVDPANVPIKLLMKVKAGVEASAVAEAAKQRLVQRVSAVDPGTAARRTLTPNTNPNTDQKPVTPDVTVERAGPTQAAVAAGTTQKSGAADVAARHADYGLDRWYRVTVNNVSDSVARSYVSDLRAQAGVEQAEIDVLSTMAAKSIVPIGDEPPGGSGGGSGTYPNDPYYVSTGSWGQSYRDEWWLQRIGASQVWPTTTGSASLIVAVVDTGVGTHAELSGRMWTNTKEIPNNGIDDDLNGYIDDVNGWNTYSDTNNVTDGHGHGTHVSGIIGAASNNGQGIASIAWQPKIMSIKALNDGGSGYEDMVAYGIVYAVDNGASVINMSWGSTEENQPLLKAALAYAHDQGVVLVAAAGNAASPVSGFFPASFPWVISVGAWGPDNNRAPFSNYGTGLDLVAPGVNVLSLRSPGTDMYGDMVHIVNSTYYIASGTSMAAPMVTGTVALLRSAVPNMTPGMVEMALDASAEDVGPAGWDANGGFGLVKPAAAITAARQITTRPAPELAVTGLTAQAMADGRRMMMIEITNIGNADAPATTYTLSEAGTNTVLATHDLPPMAAGLTTDMVATVQSMAMDIQLQIDPNHVVPERFTSNNIATSHVNVLLLNYPQVHSGYKINDVQLSDINHDGHDEIVTTWYGFDGTAMIDVENIRQESLPGWPKILPGGWAYLLVADLDQDQQVDIVAAVGASSDGVTPAAMYRWNAAGELASGWPKSIPGGIQLAAANIVGDGKLEIIGGLSGWNSGWYAWDASGTLLPGFPQEYNNTYGLGRLNLADVDGDGYGDYMKVGYGDATHNMITYIHADGTPLAGWTPHQVFGTPTSQVVADIDGDGSPEIVLGTNTFGTDPQGQLQLSEYMYAWHADGTTVAGWPVQVPHDPNMSLTLGEPAAADIDGDGKYEVVVSTMDSRVVAFKGNGTIIPGWPYLSTGAPYDWLNNSAGLADVTGDGHPELFVGGPYGQVHAISPSGKSLPSWPSPAQDDPSYPAILIGDLNGDGRRFIVFAGFMDSDSGLTVLETTNTVVGSMPDWLRTGGTLEGNRVLPMVPQRDVPISPGPAQPAAPTE